MPSPLGHAMAAVTIGWAVAGVRAHGRERLTQVATLAAIGVAPDLDLLIGRHSAETHSIGAALLVATVAVWRRWPVAAPPAAIRWRVWLAVFLAWASHPLLDALALDTSPPLGVMIFWPFEWGYHQTGWSVFTAISRRYWLPDFLAHNALAVLREILLLGPPLALAWWAGRTRTSISPPDLPSP